ncbi:MAG: TlpA family protein disulfide reductase [Acidobacteriales bacterium]|nr:TlpA family protein disulfide reductase [Terriglobales bacterium]
MLTQQGFSPRRSQSARNRAFVCALSLAVLALSASCNSPRTAPPSAANPTPSAAAGAGSQTPEHLTAFIVTDLNGEEISAATLKGKIALVDFWATWCPPCRREIPHFNQLYAEYRNQGLIIIGLALDEKAAEVRKFMRQQPIDYPVALASHELQQQFGGIEVYQTAILVDREGRVIKRYLGYIYPDEFT